MPQLDPTSFAPQLFWLVVSFVLLYLMLAQLLMPRIHSVLLFRSRTIEGDIEAAGLMKSQAEDARQHYEKALADARARSQQIFAETQAAIAARAHAGQTEMDATIEKKLSAAEAAINAARHEAMGKLAPAAAELATMIVDAMVHVRPESKEVNAAIDAVSRERSA